MSGGVVVIGGGHNGLVAALRLTAAGRKVTVVERREVLGGMAAAEEFHPGYRVPGLLHDTAALRPRIAAALGLERHGLAWRPPPPVVVAAPGREPRVLDGTVDGLAGWQAVVAALRPFVNRLQERPPPPLQPGGAADLLRLGLEGLALRRLGRRRAAELLRVLPMPVADWLGEWLTDEAAAGALALPGLLGVFAGPRSPGTAGALLLAVAGTGQEVVGGPAGLAAALTAAAEAAGVELRTGAAVTGLEVRGGRVRGLRLESGEGLAAETVAAACDPRTALLDLPPPGSLGLGDERALGSYRSRGTVAKLHLALAGAPRIAGAGGDPVELVRCGTLDDQERSFDALKYDGLPESPALELRLPSLASHELAPAGHHVASVLVLGVPERPREGWTEAHRGRLEQIVMARLEAIAPGLGELVVGRELLTPADVEKRYGAPGGHLYHGEMALDQLLSLRPTASSGHYRTPIAGLYIAGGGSHPGGGISGLPGWLAAGAILAGG